MKHPFPRFLLLVALLLGLPLAGVALAGKPLARYFEFPPRSQYIAHAGFSWVAFVFIAGFTAACVMPFVIHAFRRLPPSPLANAFGVAKGRNEVGSDGAAMTEHRPPNSERSTLNVERCAPVRHSPESFRDEGGLNVPHAFPWWGWLGLLLGAIAWVIAWNRFPWVGPLQYHTFTPLWVAYILTVNALAYRRTGHCMMLDRPRFFLLLLPLSAGFWWFFEYLNRFVQNWHYGAESFSAWEYFWYATLPFATVLAAVLGTREWLASFPVFQNRFRNLAVVPLSRRTGAVILIVAGAALAGIGVWPNALFGFLWLAPLLMLVALQMMAGEGHVLEGITRGDWRFVVTGALAALICGFFWELWNSHSLAKWYYTVPYVNRFYIFEMPLLGFAGYLPFGLECATVGMFFENKKNLTPV